MSVRAHILEDVITVELGNDKNRKALVFTATKRDADELASNAFRGSLSAAVLHGDMSQNMRDITLKEFKNNKFRVRRQWAPPALSHAP
jgi:superfamily II DNA/RNA helicase